MSHVQKLATQLAWADRKENGRRSPAKDQWAVRSMAIGGYITLDQWEAAKRLSRLIERAQGQGGQGPTEFVDGRKHDPHVATIDAIQAGFRAGAATEFVLRHLRTERRRSIFLECMSFPHRGQREIEDQSAQSFGNALAPSLELLVIWFARIDRDREEHNEKALDELTGSRHLNL